MIEIVDPKTGEPIPNGKPGVAVYTTLWEKGFPLLRYWTNDLMIRKSEVCSCGSTLPRIFYLGRLDDCYFINNQYVFPEEIENILFRYGYIGEYCVERHRDTFLVKTEGIQTKASPTLIKEAEQLFQSETRVEVVTPGSLNYDGHGKRFTEVN